MTATGERCGRWLRYGTYTISCGRPARHDGGCSQHALTTDTFAPSGNARNGGDCVAPSNPTKVSGRFNESPSGAERLEDANEFLARAERCVWPDSEHDVAEAIWNVRHAIVAILQHLRKEPSK